MSLTVYFYLSIDIEFTTVIILPEMDFFKFISGIFLFGVGLKYA